MTKNEQLHLLTTALCCGDALGSTSEFRGQQEVPSLYERIKSSGWPFVQVGGGPFNWERGDHTDDGQMAVAMVQSFVEGGCFDPSDVARRWVLWMDGNPPDIGNATRAGLSAVKRGVRWDEGGLADFRRNSQSAANGSLMRNAPVVAMADSLGQAFEFSLKQSIITHYGPLPVICCCAQSYLLWQLLTEEKTTARRWQDDFFKVFSGWLEASQDPVVRAWSDETRAYQAAAGETFRRADYDARSFNPFGYRFDGKDGYCLLTLQIAVWAWEWSRTGWPFPTPAGFAGEPFVKAAGLSFGAVVPLIGHDSDTYGAAAFPLIAATHGRLPADMTAGLQVTSKLAALGLVGSG